MCWSQPVVHTACFHTATASKSPEGIFFCLHLIMKHSTSNTLFSLTEPYLRPQQNNKYSALRCLPRLVVQCYTPAPVTVQVPGRHLALQCEEDLHVVSAHGRYKASAPW